MEDQWIDVDGGGIIWGCAVFTLLYASVLLALGVQTRVQLEVQEPLTSIWPSLVASGQKNPRDSIFYNIDHLITPPTDRLSVAERN